MTLCTMAMHSSQRNRAFAVGYGRTQIAQLCAALSRLCPRPTAVHNESSLQLLSSGGLGFLLRSWLQRRVRDSAGAFLAAECGRRLAAPSGRSSSLRCGRSTWTCSFAGGWVAAIEECPALPPRLCAGRMVVAARI
jgi:hypothetical protein